MVSSIARAAVLVFSMWLMRKAFYGVFLEDVGGVLCQDVRR